ncbi:uncharacterized protein TNIN_334161 [Trichonephila inaurata madagascariensis]|uniref:Uncharacterized protein n=1 Tax=Trichonephila inaurata madagascariensis TaxID=2747483 RepID=A0A8X7CHZ2_9ARAC|nr:uncharacterized protein TNIN_334161 [Trichonephila inaurata madagascariensis]
MKRSFYVDNLVCGVYNTSELEHFIEQAKCIMNKGFFNLRCFESNVDCKNVDKHSGDTSVLGIIWNLDNDVNTLLTYEELNTILCDCESIIDCRPLTYVSEDPEELIPLTPAMFLGESHSYSVSDIEELDSQNYQKE